jgi:hypothetical protein
MDPDMVRQQEEEEAAARLRAVIGAQAPFIRAGDKEEDKFILRAEPREPVPASAPAAPMVKAAKATRAASPVKPMPGWGGALRATLLCILLTVVGLVGGIMVGVKLGLVSWQSLALGMAAGFLFGWQSAVASIRKRYGLGRIGALRAPLVPAVIVLLALVAALGLVLPFAGRAADGADTLFLPWLISLGVGAAAGLVLALPKMRSGLRA